MRACVRGCIGGCRTGGEDGGERKKRRATNHDFIVRWTKDCQRRDTSYQEWGTIQIGTSAQMQMRTKIDYHQHRSNLLYINKHAREMNIMLNS